MLVKLDLRLRPNKGLRVGGSSEMQLTNRLKFEWEANTDKEYRVGLEYEFNKSVVISTNYDSKYYGGAGLKVKF